MEYIIHMKWFPQFRKTQKTQETPLFHMTHMIVYLYENEH